MCIGGRACETDQAASLPNSGVKIGKTGHSPKRCGPKLAVRPASETRDLSCSVEDSGLRVLGIYRVPGECRSIYVVQNIRTFADTVQSTDETSNKVNFRSHLWQIVAQKQA